MSAGYLLLIAGVWLTFAFIFALYALQGARRVVTDVDAPVECVPADFDEQGRCPSPVCDCREVARRLAASFDKHTDEALAVTNWHWTAIDELQLRRALRNAN